MKKKLTHDQKDIKEKLFLIRQIEKGQYDKFKDRYYVDGEKLTYAEYKRR